MISLSFDGPDAGAVANQTGEKLKTHTSVLGMISVALDPYEPYRIAPGHPVTFRFRAVAPGYADAWGTLTIADNGTYVCLVSMEKSPTPAGQPAAARVQAGSIREGSLEQGFHWFAQANSSLRLPDTVQVTGLDGGLASGDLIINVIRYPDVTRAISGGARVMTFLQDGVELMGVFSSAIALDLRLTTDETGEVSLQQNRKLVWQTPFAGDSGVNDSLPVWKYDPERKIWMPSGYAGAGLSDTTKVVRTALWQNGLYAVGRMESTRAVSGVVNIEFEKPFQSAQIPGVFTVTDALTGVVLQRTEAMLTSGLPVPLQLHLPEGTTADLRIQAVRSDDLFISTPSTYRIESEEEDFEVLFSLRPVKCRFSGSVSASFGEGFTGYPVAGRLRLRDATTGGNLLSQSVTISGPGFTVPLNLMVREDHPLELILEPVQLSQDFYSAPAVYPIAEPCRVDGSWRFDLQDNTCTINAEIELHLGGDTPAEPIPAELNLMRASDRRLIKKVPVTLQSSLREVSLVTTVPKNTPVILELRAAAADRPFTVETTEYQWLAPCEGVQKAVFRVVPGFVQLNGSIGFIFAPGLALESVPVRILTYANKGDRFLSEFTATVTRTDPVLSIRQYVPDESLYLKITRGTLSSPFNPEPFRIGIAQPGLVQNPWTVTLNPTTLLPVNIHVTVVCPGGEVLPTVQGYYRIPGDDWHEMNIVSGELKIVVEVGMTYEVGMILNGLMIDSIFTIEKQDIKLKFDLEPSDCEKMGWGGE